jgi:4-alpha-glucanotransferase
LVERSRVALSTARKEPAEPIAKLRFAQFLLCRQGSRLKEYANNKGVRLIGDLPFYVAGDFVRRVDRSWTVQAGRTTPATFRRRSTSRLFQRVGTTLGKSSWHVPAGAASARSGEWVPGPGAELFNAVSRELGALPFIAEDLGLITPDVPALRDRFQLPGMCVLQFAFDGKGDNPHLPRNFVSNSVVYTGTHDNPTTRGWFEELPEQQKQYFWSYLRRPAGDTRVCTRIIY